MAEGPETATGLAACRIGIRDGVAEDVEVAQHSVNLGILLIVLDGVQSISRDDVITDRAGRVLILYGDAPSSVVLNNAIIDGYGVGGSRSEQIKSTSRTPFYNTILKSQTD